MNTNRKLQRCKELLEEVSRLCGDLETTTEMSSSVSSHLHSSASTASVQPQANLLTSSSTQPPSSLYSTASTQPLSNLPSTSSTQPPSNLHSTVSTQPLANQQSNTVHPLSQSSCSSAWQEHRKLFGFQVRSVQTQGKRKAPKHDRHVKKKREATWTRTFVCLADKDSDRVPSSREYQQLKKASLGEKKITLLASDTCQGVDRKLKEEFPQLELAGGYTLACSNITRQLQNFEPPYHVANLKEECGQGKIFIIPLQKSLPITPDYITETDKDDDLLEICFKCKKVFYLHELPLHIQQCRETEVIKCSESDSDSEISILPARSSFLQSNVTAVDINDESDDGDLLSSVFELPSSMDSHSSIPCSAQPSSTATCSEVPEVVHDPAPSTEISDSKHDPLSGTSSPPLPTETFTQVPEPEHNQSPGTYPQPPPDNTLSDTPAQQKDTETPTQNKNEHKGEDIEESVKCCIEYCVSKDVHNPVEILRCIQRAVVSGRDLDITTISDSLEGEFNEILVNRYDILGSALEEFQEFNDPRLTLKVNFYGETAEDSGGPRREFFRLCLQEIKSKYFDNGLKEHLANDYKAIGQIMATSVLQNGAIPRFLSEDQLQNLFTSSQPILCIANLRDGFAKLGLIQIGRALPTFLHLFRSSPAGILSKRYLLSLLKPNFSEAGSNAHKNECTIYSHFTKYCREAASGRRENITLNHILQFVTGASEEPPLGFSIMPSLEFPQSNEMIGFTPTANTCANILNLPRPSHQNPVPSEDRLFSIYDYAFGSGYFGRL